MVVSDQKPDASQPRRSRIVIDVGGGKEKKKTSSSSGAGGGISSGGGGGGAVKILLAIVLIIAVIFGVVAAGGYFWYRSYKQTPAYSLALLADSVQRNDTQQFDRMVDLDRVAESFAPQIAERTTRGGEERSILGIVTDLAGGNDAIGRQAAQLFPGARDLVRDEFMRQAQEITAAGANVPVILIALAVPRIVDSITEENDRARVQLKIGERPVELALERAEIEGERRWRVIGVRDEQLAARIAERFPRGTIQRTVRENLPEGIPNIGDNLPLGRNRRNNNRRAERDDETETTERTERRSQNTAPGTSPTPRREREQQQRRTEDILRDLPIPIP
jgi:hypothetical protein